MKTVFTNAIFHTMEDENDLCGTIVVENGRIVALDSPAGGRSPLNIDELAAKDTKVVDLHGAHVFPALIDSHMHMMEAIAFNAMTVEICHFENGSVEPHTLTGAESIIRNHVANTKPDSLSVFANYFAATFDEGRLPTRFELDDWGAGREILVLNFDGHSSSCSTSLLKAVGLFGKVADNGILRGPDHDANIGTLTAHAVGSLTPAAIARGTAEFCNACASYGIGTICALEGTDDGPRDRAVEAFAHYAKRLPLDVRLFPQYMDEERLSRVLPTMRTPRVGGCMKWELDGSVGSHTAAFETPYINGSQGSLYFETEKLEKTIRNLAERGFTVSAHAIGELAIEQLVGIYERLNEKDAIVANPDAPGAARIKHRIDHCEFPSVSDRERINLLRPYITIQPGYSWIDKRYLHGYEKLLSPEKINQQIPLKDFAEAGIPMLGSSDAPVQTVDPYLQMRGMREFYLEDQSLSAFEALKTYTVNGGAALGEAKGLLREGYEASFFTCDIDLIKCAPSELEGFHATSLWMHGKRYKPLPASISTLARIAVTKPRLI